MEELKRTQETRTDEFSREELRESQATIQELTTQIQELQDRVNLMNDSGGVQVVESVCSGKCSHVPRRPAIVQVLVDCEDATKFCDRIHGICLVHRETFLTVHMLYSIRHQFLIKECFTRGIKVL